MRLINIRTNLIEEFMGRQVPNYAILSHTWGSEEITFQEFGQQGATAKSGYVKIQWFISLVKRDYPDLEYTWVDTCCINKDSSTELSEAINSMYRWYAQADVCVAYFEDVPPGPAGSSPPLAFHHSRWFDRGWTLQELLAPERLICVASDWSVIGTRHLLARSISLVTGIGVQYLRSPQSTGGSQEYRTDLIRQTNAAEKIGWASRRRTTKPEDLVYCLLGLLDVNMPLLYGEGEKAAFLRLQMSIVRRSADPTILAWNSLTEKQLEDRKGARGAWKDRSRPRPPSPTSAVLAAGQMLLGRCHPWYYPTERELAENVLPLGAVAEGPRNFSNNQEIVLERRNITWNFNDHTVSIRLPTSDDVHPHMLLPCRLVYDHQSLIAIPLVRYRGDYFCRAAGPWKLVHSDAWYHWPQQRVVLFTMEPPGPRERISTQLDTMSVSLCPGIHILEVYPPEYQRSPDVIDWDPSSRDRYQNRNLLALRLQSDHDGREFSILIQWLPTRRYAWLRHRIISPGGSEDVSLETLVKVDGQSTHETRRPNPFSVEITRESFLGPLRFRLIFQRALLENPEHEFSLHSTRLGHGAATHNRTAANGPTYMRLPLLGLRLQDKAVVTATEATVLIPQLVEYVMMGFALLSLTGLYTLPGAVDFHPLKIGHDIIFAFFLRWLKIPDDLLNLVLDVAIVVIDWTYMAYRLLPAASYLIPRASTGLRRFRLYISLIIGAAMASTFDHRKFDATLPFMVPVIALIFSTPTATFYLRTRPKQFSESYLIILLLCCVTLLYAYYIQDWMDDPIVIRVLFSTPIPLSSELVVRGIFGSEVVHCFYLFLDLAKLIPPIIALLFVLRRQ